MKLLIRQLLFGISTLYMIILDKCSGLSMRTASSSDKIDVKKFTDKNAVSTTTTTSNNRRDFLGLALAGAPIMVASLTSVPSASAATDERLFRPNPLLNPVLEQLRIWEQVDADNIKYGGELEMGDAGNKGKVNAYPTLLIPILKIDQELNEIKTLVHSGDNNSKPSKDAMSKALTILQSPTYDKITFKKTFNKYGDNIYYSDPDRANMYLGGGATPKNEQSIAYLLRNDILTSMENLRAELEFLIKTTEEENESREDLYTYADIVTSAMKKYLAQVPPNELKEAQQALVSS
jgi:hypothetical protein